MLLFLLSYIEFPKTFLNVPSRILSRTVCPLWTIYNRCKPTTNYHYGKWLCPLYFLPCLKSTLLVTQVTVCAIGLDWHPVGPDFESSLNTLNLRWNISPAIPLQTRSRIGCTFSSGTPFLYTHSTPFFFFEPLKDLGSLLVSFFSDFSSPSECLLRRLFLHGILISFFVFILTVTLLLLYGSRYPLSEFLFFMSRPCFSM